ncbi:MAG: hypothetical protein HC769_28840 [Cyanobacteria bacterium CRU_2_1]|nr:hypothetical protein [Cyanobacteria bacterium RU_5_0]NJR62460.1 hypothetical protein [Cyanobacteria bacterium CRU_2_1]
MARIHISALSKPLTNISQEPLIHLNGGSAIALPSFLNQANKSRSTSSQAEELRSYAFAALEIN